MNREDTVRLNELKTRIYGVAAKKLLSGEGVPFEIEKDAIESHAGRIDKALRLLNEDRCIKLSRIEKKEDDYYKRESAYYAVLKYETDSKTLEKCPVFINKWNDLYKEIFSYHGMPDSDTQMSLVGYLKIDNLDNAEALYVYWHKELFNFITQDKHQYVYPLADLVTRTRGMLRAIVEHCIYEEYHDLLANLLGYKKGSLYREETFNISYRNVAHNIVLMTKEAMDSFIAEYQHRMTFFKSLYESLLEFKSKTEAAGGYEEIVRTLRKGMIDDLYKKAPLRINIQKDANNTETYLARFILKSADHFKYDILYGSDESVMYLDKNRVDAEHNTKFEILAHEVLTFNSAHEGEIQYV